MEMTNCYGVLCTTPLWAIFLLAIEMLFGLFCLFVMVRGSERNENRPRGLRLGHPVHLNAFNSRVVYADSGLCTYETESGQTVVLYETEKQKEIAEHFFTGGRYNNNVVIVPMDAESKFGFEHPSYGCSSHDKNDPRYRKVS